MTKALMIGCDMGCTTMSHETWRIPMVSMAHGCDTHGGIRRFGAHGDQVFCLTRIPSITSLRLYLQIC